MSARRSIQVFNMSFLDMMTNFLGAVIILFLLAAKDLEKRPFPNVKAEAKVIYNEKTRDISGQIPPGVLNALKAGDTLLVIIDKKVFEDGKSELAPIKPPASNGVVLNEDEVVVKREEKDAYEAAKKNPESPCMIFTENIKVSACNNNNTPNNKEDDTYKVDLQLNYAGKCAASQLWRDDKSSGVTKYGQTKSYTFKMKDGPQKITISDFGSPSVTKVVNINPPVPCDASNSNTAGTPKKQVFPPPPGINFQIEFDEKSGQNVDLWVEKNGKYVFGNKRKEDFGTWDNDKRGFLNDQKTGLERVRQLGEPIPGTYKVYAHYRQSGTAPPSIKVSLYLSSQKAQQSDKLEFNVPQSKNNPRSGGGMLLKTVTVLSDGSLKY